jgi:hypothetical protein
MREDFAAQVAPLVDAGIDVVIPAGGYPMLLFAGEPGFTIGGAVVLNGLAVTLATAEAAVRLRRLTGTGTSRRGAYALPPPEAVAEFREQLG